MVVNVVILKNEAKFPQDGNLVDRAEKVLAEAFTALDALVELAEAEPDATLRENAARLEDLSDQLAALQGALRDGVAAEFTA